MNLKKAQNRERKQNKNKKGMQLDNRSIILLEEIKRKKAQKIKIGEKNNG